MSCEDEFKAWREADDALTEYRRSIMPPVTGPLSDTGDLPAHTVNTDQLARIGELEDAAREARRALDECRGTSDG